MKLNYKLANLFLPFLVIIVLFSNCTSIKKYNTQITAQHTPTELKKDIDYAYKKLQRLHPDLYLYISKDSLDHKFGTLKNSIQQPLSSLDFYKRLAPVIVSIKQGHTALYPPYKKQSKKEKKKQGKRKNPFRSIKLSTINNRVFIAKNYSKDTTILVGSELLEINNKPIEKLVQSYQKFATGDGYNKIFAPQITRKYVGTFYNRLNKQKDSILLTLKNKDSSYHKYIYAFLKETKKNSVHTKKLTKPEKKLAKTKSKARKKWEHKYGYNNFTKETVRNFKFIETDSTPTIAYMKIRGFHSGSYKDFYKECFTKIDSAKSNNLIIDLRDNSGGRLSEIANLYSYLTNKEYVFINKAKMTKRSSWVYPFSHNKSFLIKSAVFILYPIVKIFELIKVKSMGGTPYFKLSSSKLKKPTVESNYKGKVYVLINELSFSASSILSNNLQASKRAFLVGTETGGAYNSTVAGIFAPIELPNSKNMLVFGLMSLETPNKTIPDGYGVKPDKYIKVTTLHKDEQLDWIINDITKKKLSD